MFGILFLDNKIKKISKNNKRTEIMCASMNFFVFINDKKIRIVCMVWRMICITSRENIMTFTDVFDIENIFQVMMTEIKRYSSPYTVVIGHKTYRNLTSMFDCPIHVFTKNRNASHLSPDIFVNDISEIPDYEGLNVWFVGSVEIYNSFICYMDEIVRVQYNFFLNDYIPNILPNTSTTRIYFNIPSEFVGYGESRKNIATSQNGSDYIITADTFKRRILKEKSNRLDISKFNFHMGCSVKSLYAYKYVFDVKCGIPLFHSDCYHRYMVDEFTNSLSNKPVADFCSRFHVSEEDVDLSDFGAKLQMKLDEVLEKRTKCVHYIHKNPVSTRDFEFYVYFTDTEKEIYMSLHHYITEMDIYSDYSYVITYLSLLLYTISHYMTQNDNVYRRIHVPSDICVFCSESYYHVKNEMHLPRHIVKRMHIYASGDLCDYESKDYILF